MKTNQNEQNTRKQNNELSVLNAINQARQGVPGGEYHVDAEALQQARQGVPGGEYHVDAEALQQARQGVPGGEYHVDAEALQQARQGVPGGEYHALSPVVSPSWRFYPVTRFLDWLLSGKIVWAGVKAKHDGP